MITIVIPTIGSVSADYFDAAIASAFQVNKEIVSSILIIDNSQKQDFLNSLQAYQARDSRVKIVVAEDRLSMANSWNFGLSHIKTEWHLYLHDDDVINYETLNGIDELKEAKFGFISFDFNVLQGQNRKRVTRKSGMTGILDNTPKFISTIINTKKLKKLNGWDDDAGYFLDLLAFVKLESVYSSKHVSQVLGDYRVHAENASAREKRSSTYGESLPYVLLECYKFITCEKSRRALLFHIASFSFPHRSLINRLVCKLLRLLGKEVWIND